MVSGEFELRPLSNLKSPRRFEWEREETRAGGEGGGRKVRMCTEATLRDSGHEAGAEPAGMLEG